jgi:hypothetical protein
MAHPRLLSALNAYRRLPDAAAVPLFDGRLDALQRPAPLTAFVALQVCG